MELIIFIMILWDNHDLPLLNTQIHNTYLGWFTRAGFASGTFNQEFAFTSAETSYDYVVTIVGKRNFWKIVKELLPMQEQLTKLKLQLSMPD
jgi:hypothetical protein